MVLRAVLRWSAVPGRRARREWERDLSREGARPTTSLEEFSASVGDKMVSKAQHDELCTAYAAMALFDGEADITSEQLKTLIEATGNEVEPYWPMLFARYCSKDMASLMFSFGGDAKEEKKEEKKEEEEEEVDMGGGMDMFGDSGGGGGDY